jgi:hypothetical protein
VLIPPQRSTSGVLDRFKHGISRDAGRGEGVMNFFHPGRRKIGILWNLSLVNVLDGPARDLRGIQFGQNNLFDERVDGRRLTHQPLHQTVF